MNQDRDTTVRKISSLLSGNFGSGYLRGSILWGPVAVWAGIIVAATSAPTSGEPLINIPHFDLVAHAGFYGVFGVVLHRAVFWGTRFGPLGRAWLVAYVAGQVFGILDELHQIPIPDRFCDPADVLADGIGVILGVFFYYLCFVRRGRTDKTPGR